MKEDSPLSEHISISIWIQYIIIFQRNDFINAFQDYLIFKCKKMNLKAHKIDTQTLKRLSLQYTMRQDQYHSSLSPGLVSALMK